ncbi:MAG: hypothetical protein LBS40_05060 [Burkholderiales bacterium]|nr:hypothetical protein [Burkholderiales bacterium]
MSHISRLFMIVLMATVSLSAQAQTSSPMSDYTDIWWNPSASGSGVNMVQTNQFIFATFFIYDTEGNPFWYTAEMDYQNNVFTGIIVETSSGPTADIWTPVNIQRKIVGNATFTPESSTRGFITLTFNDGRRFTKQVERLTLRAPTIQEDDTATYQATIKTKYEEDARGRDQEWFTTHISTMRFVKENGYGTLSFVNNEGISCQITGPLHVKGRQYEIDDDFGRYTCTNGFSAQAELDLQFTSSGGMTGSWETEKLNREEEAHFTAIRQ